MAAPVNKVSVVMPVYNAGKYLDAAVESILKQTYKDFEFIIINDGSTDGSLTRLQHYAKQDKRITLISQTNQGIVKALNRGLAAAQGTFVARMDADDISLPARIAKQVTVLEAHPEVVLVGCGLEFIDADSKVILDSPMLTDDVALRLELLLRSPAAHGSIMLRRSALESLEYRQNYYPAEDYDLWHRLALVGKLANVRETLFQYRDMQAGISARNVQKQAAIFKKIQTEIWQDTGSLKLRTGAAEAIDRYSGAGSLVSARAVANYRAIWRQAIQRRKMGLALRLTFGLLTSRLVRHKIMKRLGLSKGI